MRVYQVIMNKYDDDDGHYQYTPESVYVYVEENDAIARRNVLNLASITEHNELFRNYAERYGEIAHSVATKHTFTGDPHDAQAVAQFANRHNGFTYFTIDTLAVLR